MSAQDHARSARSRTDLVPSVGNPAHAERSEALLDAFADAPAPVFARCPTPGCIGSCDYGHSTCNRCRERAEEKVRRVLARGAAGGLPRYARGWR